MKWTIMSTLRDPNQWKRFALIFLIGLLLHVWVLDYLIAVVVFSKQNILDAPQEALKFMINPANVAETFFVGADSQDDLKSSVYKLYSHGTVQAIYWVCFTLLLIRRYMIKGPGKKAADKIGSHGSARWATKAEIRKRFTKDEKGFIVGKSNFQKKLIQPVQSSLNQLAIIFGGSDPVSPHPLSSPIFYIYPNT